MIKTVLHCLLSDFHENNWKNKLSKTEFIINTVKSFTIEYFLFKVLYSVKSV